MKKLSFFAFWTLLKILLSSFGSHQCYCNSQLFTLHFLPEKLYIADPGIFSLRKFYPNYALIYLYLLLFFSCNLLVKQFSLRLSEFLVILSDFLKLLFIVFHQFFIVTVLLLVLFSNVTSSTNRTSGTSSWQSKTQFRFGESKFGDL